MAIQRDRQQIGIQPSGRMIREFRTDLPEPTTGSMISRFGSTLGEVGEGLMKQEADRAAKEAIAAAPVKDVNGNYVAPPPPEGFGPYAAKIYSDAIDTRYKNNVFQDFQTKLNVIAAENQTNPVKAFELMSAHARGVMKGMDQRFAGELEANFTREINERQRGILNLNASREREATVQDLRVQLTRYNEQAIDAWSRASGNPELEAEARRLQTEALNTQRRLIELGADTAMSVGQLENVQRSNQFAGTIISALNRGIEEGTLTPEALADVHMISQGLGGKKSVTIGGMKLSADDVLREVSDPRVRQMLGTRINTIRTDMSAAFARDVAAENTARINRVFDENPAAAGFPVNVTPEQQRNAVITWAQQNGVDPRTPEGYQRIVTRYGEVPQSYYKEIFSNMTMKTAAQVEGLRPLWERMGETIKRDGTYTNSQSVLDTKEDAFMWWYSTLRGNNQGMDPVAAVEMARNNVQRGMTRLTTESASNIVVGSFRSSTNNQAATFSDVFNKINSATDIDVTKLGDDAKRNFMSIAASYLASDMPFEAAINQAARHFKSNFEANPFTLSFAMKGKGGFTEKATNPPMLPNTEGVMSYDYLKPLVDVAVREMADKNQPGGFTTDKLELGKNLWLKQVGTSPSNPSYQLHYYDKSGVNFPILTPDNKIVTMFAGNYIKAQTEYAGSEYVKNQREIRSGIAGINIGELSGAPIPGRSQFAAPGAPPTPPNAPSTMEGFMATEDFGLGAVDAEGKPVAPAQPAPLFIQPRPEHVMPPPMIRRMLERPTEPIELRTLPKTRERRSDAGGTVQPASFGGEAGPAPTTITRAMEFLGVDERSGRSTLTAFFNKTIGEAVDPVNTPWCATFVNGILRETGYLGTNSKLARSFLAYGETPEQPSDGDIVVLRRGNSEVTGHVGFFMGYTERNGQRFVRVLGGNQGDKVSEQLFPANTVLGIRRPIKLQEARNLPGIEGTTFAGFNEDIG